MDYQDPAIFTATKFRQDLSKGKQGRVHKNATRRLLTVIPWSGEPYSTSSGDYLEWTRKYTALIGEEEPSLGNPHSLASQPFRVPSRASLWVRSDLVQELTEVHRPTGGREEFAVEIGLGPWLGLSIGRTASYDAIFGTRRQLMRRLPRERVSSLASCGELPRDLAYRFMHVRGEGRNGKRKEPVSSGAMQCRSEIAAVSKKQGCNEALLLH
ncbi:hypothetical protein LZ30DRAFT_192825 [Colletotrichum cereale]|nr:hypothetical protein LZ30DRAFT_192825 [Colletotrichum cereale]